MTTRPQAPPIATPPSSGTCSSAASTWHPRSSRRCSSRLPTPTPTSTAPSRPLATSTTDLWGTIALEAERESPLWGAALRPPGERETEPVFSPLAEERFALGLETIYEAYLLHYGRPRLFAPADGDTALLLGDYLYAHGLVRIAAFEDVAAVADLAELISLCAQLRASGADGDGAAWAATAALLGRGGLDEARAALREDGDEAPLAEAARAAAGADAVDRALRAHRSRVG